MDILWEDLYWMATNYPSGFFGGAAVGILSITFKNWPAWLHIALLLAPSYLFGIYAYMYRGELAWGTIATQFGCSLAGILAALCVMAMCVVLWPSRARSNTIQS